MGDRDAVLGPEELASVLRRAAGLLAGSTELDPTMAHTVAACLPSLGDFGYFDLVVGDEVRRTARAHEDPELDELLRPTRWIRQQPSDLNLCALSTGAPGLHVEIDDAWYRKVAVDDGHLAILRRLAFCSMVTVPMRYGAELVGALTLFYGRSGRQFSEDHVAFATELATLAVPAVVNARLAEQRARAEVALRASEQRARLAIETMRLGTWDWAVEDDVITWSDRSHELLGVRRGEFGGRLADLIALIHPDDRALVRTRVEAALATGAEYDVEFRVCRPDGTLAWINGRAAVLREPGSTRMFGAGYEVTDRVELLAAERAARTAAELAQRRLELLADAGDRFARSLDRAATLDAVAELVLPGTCELCRVDLIDEDGNLALALNRHVDAELARAAFEVVKRSRLPATVEGSIAWVLEHRRPHLLRFTPELLAQVEDRELAALLGKTQASVSVPLVARDRMLGVLSIAYGAHRALAQIEDDIPLIVEVANRAALALDNARLYAAAEHARREAETASRAKDEFLAVLGHELRNPLAPIVTTLRLMERRGDGAFAREHASISRQVTHLSRLVDDMLDVSRIVRGNVKLDLRRVDLAALVEHELEASAPAFAENGIALAHDRPTTPLCVRGDAIRLAQVIGNLLSNALVYTPAGGRISVRLAVVDGWVELVVEDTGAGIAPELLPTVFELFVQGVQPLDRERGGLGLGLSIVANLVGLHGGTVTAGSHGIGRGSTFCVRIPRDDGEVTAAAAAARTPVAPVSGRVLLVDDHHESALVLAELLRDFGLEAEVVTDGIAALGRLADERFDVAVFDIGLPGMSGYELARRLRSTPSLEGVPLIAMTGYADRGSALSAGFDEHLVKPVMPEALIEAIERVRAQVKA